MTDKALDAHLSDRLRDLATPRPSGCTLRGADTSVRGVSCSRRFATAARPTLAGSYTTEPMTNYSPAWTSDTSSIEPSPSPPAWVQDSSRRPD